MSGAAWTTAGRFGGALNFDGVNDWVTVADSSSLDLTGPLTLQAWVKPDVLGSWDTVLMKEGGSFLVYALYATGDWQVPSGWARDANAQGTQFLSTTAWSHMAYTFDGTVSKLYINGVLVSSATMPFTLPNTTQPLRIGGNGIWSGEFFDGLIDEVRVYNRSLSAAEVTADMGRGIGTAASAAKSVPTGLRSMAWPGPRTSRWPTCRRAPAGSRPASSAGRGGRAGRRSTKAPTAGRPASSGAARRAARPAAAPRGAARRPRPARSRASAAGAASARPRPSRSARRARPAAARSRRAAPTAARTRSGARPPWPAARCARGRAGCRRA